MPAPLTPADDAAALLRSLSRDITRQADQFDDVDQGAAAHLHEVAAIIHTAAGTCHDMA